jgi:SSS family solute:Na+ symporter
MDRTLIYWGAFIIYSLVVIAVGFYIYKRDRKSGQEYDNQSYWAAGKTLSGWASGLSISASMMSISWSCVYGVQLFYWYGVGGAWLLIIPWLVTMAGFFLFTPLFRKMEIFSQPELLEKRFGKKVRQFLAVPLIFVFTTWAGAEIYAAGITIAPFLDISVPITIFIIAVVVALYSFTGGFKAVVSTDKIQFALVAVFILTIAIVGIGAAFSISDFNSFWSVVSKPPKMHKEYSIFFSPGIALILMTFFAYLPGWLVETDVWIRLQAAKSNKHARRGVLLASLNSFIFVGLLPLVIGLTALYLYPAAEGNIPARLNDGALIFSVMMQDFTPLWLNAILGIGLVAAAMSTIDTCGNVVALSISYDLVEPQLQSRINSDKLNTIARWTSVFAIFLAFVYALFTESLWDIFYLSSGVLTTTVFLPVIASFLPGSKTSQVKLAIIFGFVGTILFYFMEIFGYLKNIEPAVIAETGLGYIILGFIASVLGFILGGILKKKAIIE